MASIHVAYLKVVNVGPGGNIVNKDTATIAQVMTASLSIRVIPDDEIASSIDTPTVKTYLEREVSDGYLFQHIDQTMVITQKP